MDVGSAITGWHEGAVDRSVAHFLLSYGSIHDGSEPDAWPEIAVVGPPYRGQVVVEFLVDRSDESMTEAVDATIREIEFYLIELGHEDAWRYCLYHCGTMSNVYSNVHWGGFMSDLEQDVVGFGSALQRFRGFDRLSFTVGELNADRSWDWGAERGVYCFVVDGEVVYVGRALGCTLGERIADQLRHTEDPKWAEVVEADDTRIETFLVGEEAVFLVAALEAYLIDTLEPRPGFNSRIS